MNTKLLLAPVLAVTLALLLAGAISVILPQDQTNYVYTVGSTSTFTPPIPAPTAAPQAASMTDLYSVPLFVMFIVAAVIVGIAAVLLFFREKNLKDQP